MAGWHYPAWLAVLVALLIGAFVRLLRLPVPAPPTVTGALMVLAMTVGYLLANWLLTR